MKNENREIQIITIRLFDINFPLNTLIFQLLQHTKRAYNVCYNSYSCSLPLIPSAITGVTRVTGYSSSSITARCFFIAYVRYPFSGLTL